MEADFAEIAENIYNYLKEPRQSVVKEKHLNNLS